MPNYITTNITMSGPTEDREELLNKVKNDESLFDFNQIIPMPTELKSIQAPVNLISKKKWDSLDDEEQSKFLTRKMSAELIDKFGSDNWYDWANKNWNTKWNAECNMADEHWISLETAWGTPYTVIGVLSTLFPTITFYVEYADEDLGANCGTYTLKDGEVLEDIDKGDGDDESIRWAIGVKYGEDMIDEIWESYGYGDDD